MGICWILQGAELSALWWPREMGWGRLRREEIYYTHGWFTFLYGGNQHTIVKQLSSNQKKKWRRKKKKNIQINFKKERKKERKKKKTFWRCSCLRFYLHHPKSQIIFYIFSSVSYLSLHSMTLISWPNARLPSWNHSNCTYIAA